MHFPTYGLISALLVSLVAAAPADLDDRMVGPPRPPIPPPKPKFSCYHAADPDGAQGYCPAVSATGWCECSDNKIYAIEPGPNPCGYTATPAAGPTILPSTNCNPPTATPTQAAASRNKCSQDICPDLCSIGNAPSKRSLGTLDYNPLTKRFYENSDPDKFPYGLLEQSYTNNICPNSPVNTYIWKPLRTEYAAALQGLCGCTTIFVASAQGVFSSHLWEEDKANNPPRDLQPANYKNTLKDLETNLSPKKASLTNGEAFLIVPVDPDHTSNYLYGNDIVNAISASIKSASDITPTIVTYVPEDFKTSTRLGKDRLGTASFQYDPAYTNGNGQKSKAYRVISEARVLSLRENL